jgi:hypothetical protein
MAFLSMFQNPASLSSNAAGIDTARGWELCWGRTLKGPENLPTKNVALEDVAVFMAFATLTRSVTHV